jgi:alpha-beta hydrolase superfamily lysophospholipase
MQKERNMNQESHELVASDGLKLFAQSWSTEKKPKALVVIVHGLGEHSGRYAHVAKVLNENGIQVFSFDQRGHGKSEGPRGHTPSGEQLMYDVVKAINVAKETFEPDLPVFLYGRHDSGRPERNHRHQPSFGPEQHTEVKNHPG